MHVTTRAKGLDAEIDRVVRMAERAADLTPVMRGRAEVFRGMIATKVFGKQTDPFGRPWAPLAESTVEGRRNKKKSSIKILRDTGRLAALIVARATPTGMTFGSADVEGKANAHLFGTRKAGRNRNVTIPRRAFLPVDKTGRANFGTGPAAEWLARASERIKAWVEKGKL